MEEDKKTNFINTLINLDGNLPKGMSECEKYGMFFGCDKCCPVFRDGKCELQQELEEQWKKI